METWHPLGVCAVVTAFNFPVAVWAWNTALALVCGDPVVWKPSEKTSAPWPARLCSTRSPPRCPRRRLDRRPSWSVGEAATALADHPDVALVSATGSTAMGAPLAPVAARFGPQPPRTGRQQRHDRHPSADLDLAPRAIVFAAAGTAGQRCTTLRRLLVHESWRSPCMGA